MAHTFRYFVDADRAAIGAVIELGATDADHVRVTRASAGDIVEIVDGSGALWRAAIVDRRTVEIQDGPLEQRVAGDRIIVYAGVATGQRWDDLVDGCVQAGVDRVVPVSVDDRQRSKITRRLERSARVAAAAARQSKRLHVPAIDPCMSAADIPAPAPGDLHVVLCEHDAGVMLIDVLRDRLVPGGRVALFVGPPAGIDDSHRDTLVAAGWIPASLGTTVLRSELAAACAVSCAHQHIVATDEA